jgi:hypothetical protein
MAATAGSANTLRRFIAGSSQYPSCSHDAVLFTLDAINRILQDQAIRRPDRGLRAATRLDAEAGRESCRRRRRRLHRFPGCTGRATRVARHAGSLVHTRHCRTSSSALPDGDEVGRAGARDRRAGIEARSDVEEAYDDIVWRKPQCLLGHRVISRRASFPHRAITQRMRR